MHSKLVDKIIKELRGRKGFDNVWDEMDEETQAELEEKLGEIATKEVLHYVAIYSMECNKVLRSLLSKTSGFSQSKQIDAINMFLDESDLIIKEECGN